MPGQIYTREEIAGIVLPLLKKYKAESAILFGSYARREADAGSDIDLLVIGGPLFELTDVFSLADDLHRITRKNVDVYELCEINTGTDLYDAILSEGVRLACPAC